MIFVDIMPLFAFHYFDIIIIIFDIVLRRSEKERKKRKRVWLMPRQMPCHYAIDFLSFAITLLIAFDDFSYAFRLVDITDTLAAAFRFSFHYCHFFAAFFH
jgi:hypothetical protein